MTKSFSKLLNEGNNFIQFLNLQNITATIIEDSFRDYHIKIKCLNSNIILYHKASKNTFSIGTHEITNHKIKIQIEELWHSYKFPQEVRNRGLCAYVDGSFLNNKIGWGLILVEANKIILEKNGIVKLSAEEGGRQIAGEVQAVLEAINYAQINHIKEITIFYDYKGLEMWATKKWKAQSAIAQYYIGKLMQHKIKIIWQKISAHTGHIFNERADKLAKQATQL